jgi:Enoyl-(Acyl carrier protein) reductase
MYREMNDTADKQAVMTNLHALKRVARSEELARSVLHLASDDSAFVTGTASLVDGGASITRSCARNGRPMVLRFILEKQILSATVAFDHSRHSA